MSGKGDGIIIWAGAGAAGGDEYKQPNERFSGIPIGTIGFNQDGAATANVYHWNGGAWIDTGQTVAGYYVASSPNMTYTTYSGNGYTYWCEAAVGSALSDEVWHVVRKTDATGTMIHAGIGGFNHPATDLAAVTALTYTLEA